jgi:hypothetical protein
MIIWSGQGSGFYNDVWAFDLSLHAWQKMAPSGIPPTPRYGSASVFDPLNRRMVMFSGFTDSGRYDDTQGYDIAANTWVDLTPAGTNPLARCLHTASYDGGRHRMIIYAGQRTGPLNDIWAFDLTSNTWEDLTPASKPSGRIFPTSVYAGNKIIIFGGSTNSGSVNELWSFDLTDTSWEMINASGMSPAPRHSHAAIFVEQENAMYIFGGTGDTAYNDVWKLTGLPTGLREFESIPVKFELYQNFPNPFNPMTHFGFRILDFGLVRLRVYDVLGREVETIVNEELSAGEYIRTWDARQTASGVYVYRLQSGNSTVTRRMMVLR